LVTPASIQGLCRELGSHYSALPRPSSGVLPASRGK